MKQIYIARHASAAAASAAISDFDRPLLPEGVAEAEQVGARLIQQGSSVDCILSSPARRARETAEILARCLSFPTENIIFDKLIFDAPDTEPILNLMKELDDNFQSVLVCGHNPVLQRLAITLSPEFNASLPAGAVVGISVNIGRWIQLKENSGELKLFTSPKK